MVEKILLYLTLITNLFICSGVIRHWNNLPNNMTENVRHWKQTTTGRKGLPITETKKSKKSKEPKSLEEALTGE